MKYSRWFAEEEKPGRSMRGVYPTRYMTLNGSFTYGYSYWYGGIWSPQWASKRIALSLKGMTKINGTQGKEWRGLNEKGADYE